MSDEASDIDMEACISAGIAHAISVGEINYVGESGPLACFETVSGEQRFYVPFRLLKNIDRLLPLFGPFEKPPIA